MQSKSGCILHSWPEIQAHPLYASDVVVGKRTCVFSCKTVIRGAGTMNALPDFDIELPAQSALAVATVPWVCGTVVDDY